MRRYPAYKDSGVEWLGEVPEGWQVLNPRRLFAQVRDPALPDDEQLSATQKSGVIPQRLYMEQEDHKVVLALAGLDNFKRVRIGDFVISLRSFQGGIEYSAYGGCVSPAYTVLRPTDSLDGGYYRYLLKSDEFILKLQSVTSGIRDGRNVSYEQFAMVPLCVPPLPEQTAIAAFLDRETTKIDALVAEQRRLIDLLKEKRQAVISQAVTKGLNPNAPLKPSGIDWLGDVPEGWEVVRLKRDLLFLTSGSRGWAEHYSDDGALFLRIGNLPREGVALDLNDIQRVVVPEGAEGQRTRVAAGDVLFSITAYLGSVAVVPDNLETAYVSQHVALARLRQQRMLPEWIAYVALSMVGKTYLAEQGYGGTKIQLSLDDVANLIVPLPTKDEQAEILRFIAEQTAILDTLTATAETAITLLQERRAALISAAVTGKMDVRPLAANEEEAA
jgi:type I restriction enzyme S subunit